MYGKYLQCLQCGHTQDVNLVSNPAKPKYAPAKKVSDKQRVAA
jgi:hypothetical protein